MCPLREREPSPPPRVMRLRCPRTCSRSLLLSRERGRAQALTRQDARAHLRRVLTPGHSRPRSSRTPSPRAPARPPRGAPVRLRTEAFRFATRGVARCCLNRACRARPRREDLDGSFHRCTTPTRTACPSGCALTGSGIDATTASPLTLRGLGDTSAMHDPAVCVLPEKCNERRPRQRDRRS